mmetsp:Transcript_684/g.503  ORF Transcript_684/g.503 Transcript_684/m.503 type:complete len:199 (+) Transcript_684:44-640(+)
MREASSNSFSSTNTCSKGKLYIISASSGAGKTSLCRAVLKKNPNLIFSISYTTRKIRQEETAGKDYFFISKEEFELGIKKGRWLEWAKVHGNYYGTCAKFINSKFANGFSIILDIDVCGAMQIIKMHPEAVTIFIMPPSMDELKKRLEKRGTDDNKTIETRLKNVKKEIGKKDMYNHIIINDSLNEAIDELRAIVKTG